jgi:hypothetical protein
MLPRLRQFRLSRGEALHRKGECTSPVFIIFYFPNLIYCGFIACAVRGLL